MAVAGGIWVVVLNAAIVNIGNCGGGLGGMIGAARGMKRRMMEVLGEFGRRRGKARRRQNDCGDEGPNRPKMHPSECHRRFV